MPEIDIPDVVAEVRKAFEEYEKALVNNDVDKLDELFRDDPRTIRYGAGEILYGYAQIKAIRAARSLASPARKRMPRRAARPAATRSAACDGVSADQPKGMENSATTLAVTENHNTMVAVFSVWTRLRTRIMATADTAAETSTATTPTPAGTNSSGRCWSR